MSIAISRGDLAPKNMMKERNTDMKEDIEVHTTILQLVPCIMYKVQSLQKIFLTFNSLHDIHIIILFLFPITLLPH